ncbi:MAG TPA: hypothetical protein DCS07_08710 [Bdellovibrionales bacterium]|nr:MAG: hypothetical protein A2Z97_02810 [Bdellovibrionales bacterium GWB1_52_6]OFZ05827.1 MAG: hypothetical protein A2X97_03960 [Bdellovibrionales bacterium GWA1_52_35]OFZ39336.1 MAG: hypothetical protein A2070_03640 [Bdellovibrionales bacterium GWC1_52_8]HAR42690.1 hypothetical protein [Bdellovibrionales bacterium]HCM40228.1 hypothetical protein [Bdellovibrionales bacterium]
MSRIAILVGVMMVSVPAAAFAEAITSPFEACKGIEIKSVSKNSKEDFKICDTCRTQSAPEISRLSGSLENTQFATIAMDFLGQVAERAQGIMEKNVKTYTELKACLDAPAGKGCSTKIAAFKKDLKAAEREKGLSTIISQQLIGNAASNAARAPTNRRIFSPNGGYWNSAVSDGDIIKAESEVRAIVAGAKNACAAQKKPSYELNCDKMAGEAVAEYAKHHKDNINEVVYGKMPVIAFIPTLKGKQDLYSNATLSKAVTGLIAAGKSQIEITKKSIKDGNLEFANIGKNRDLVDYIAFTPVVEKLLKEHPGYCGIASSLAQRAGLRRSSNQFALGGAALAAFIPGGLYVGTLSGAAAITGAGALNVAGLALGLGFTGSAWSEYKTTKDATVSGIQEVKVLEEKAKELQLMALLHPLDYIGVGTAAKAVGNKFLKGFVTAAEKVKTDSKALNGLKTLATDVSKTIDSEQAAKIAFANQGAYKAKVVKSARQSGLTKQEANQVADCIASNKGCEKSKALLAKIGEPSGANTARVEAVAGKVVQSAADEAIDFAKIDTSYLNMDLRGKLAAKYKKASRQDVDYFDKIRVAFMEDPNFVALCAKGASNCAKQDDIIYHLFNKMETQGAGRNSTQVKAEIEKILNSCGWGKG